MRCACTPCLGPAERAETLKLTRYQTTGSVPIFALAIFATVLVVTLWLLLWLNR